MKIAVMGAGGVGGYLGGKLAATGAHDVAFIARGAHLEALRSKGLRVVGADEFAVSDVTATNDPQTIGPADLVIFTVKLRDTDGAAAMLPPLIGTETAVLTLQNGIESVDRVGAVVGAGAMLGGAAYFPASLTAPGEITYHGRAPSQPHILFGEADGGPSARVEAIRAACVAAGIAAGICPDTRLMLWEKFLLIAGTSATTTVTRQGFGAVRDDPDMRALFVACVEEAAAVGRAAGVAVTDAAIAKAIEVLDGFPADGKASQLVDLENGRPLELEGLSGAVARLGASHGVPTPVHATVYAALKPFRDGR